MSRVDKGTRMASHEVRAGELRRALLDSRLWPADVVRELRGRAEDADRRAVTVRDLILSAAEPDAGVEPVPEDVLMHVAEMDQVAGCLTASAQAVEQQNQACRHIRRRRIMDVVERLEERKPDDEFGVACDALALVEWGDYLRRTAIGAGYDGGWRQLEQTTRTLLREADAFGAAVPGAESVLVGLEMLAQEGVQDEYAFEQWARAREQALGALHSLLDGMRDMVPLNASSFERLIEDGSAEAVTGLFRLETRIEWRGAFQHLLQHRPAVAARLLPDVERAGYASLSDEARLELRDRWIQEDPISVFAALEADSGYRLPPDFRNGEALLALFRRLVDVASGQARALLEEHGATLGRAAGEARLWREMFRGFLRAGDRHGSAEALLQKDRKVQPGAWLEAREWQAWIEGFIVRARATCAIDAIDEWPAPAGAELAAEVVQPLLSGTGSSETRVAVMRRIVPFVRASGRSGLDAAEPQASQGPSRAVRRR